MSRPSESGSWRLRIQAWEFAKFPHSQVTHMKSPVRANDQTNDGNPNSGMYQTVQTSDGVERRCSRKFPLLCEHKKKTFYERTGPDVPTLKRAEQRWKEYWCPTDPVGPVSYAWNPSSLPLDFLMCEIIGFPIAKPDRVRVLLSSNKTMLILKPPRNISRPQNSH